MAKVSYLEWRGRADAYLSQTQHDASRWCLSEVLAMLRHTGGGQGLWNEARRLGFFAKAAQ